ncbi:MAG: GNAT family N-acetyltransferase [Dermatophilaceae bacterium]
METKGQSSVLLRPLRNSDEKQAWQAHEELGPEGFEFLLNLEQGEPWPVYLERLERLRHGIGLSEGWVPATFLVAEAEGQVVGRVSIRHELNAFLADVGGHIGYGVRPGFRRRGYATSILRQSLAIAASLRLARVLVTCDDDNVGSARVIESCAGVLENVVPGRDGSPPRRRYWINLEPPR